MSDKNEAWEKEWKAFYDQAPDRLVMRGGSIVPDGPDELVFERDRSVPYVLYTADVSYLKREMDRLSQERAERIKRTRAQRRRWWKFW